MRATTSRLWRFQHDPAQTNVVRSVSQPASQLLRGK
jgi:hypothetical protein